MGVEGDTFLLDAASVLSVAYYGVTSGGELHSDLVGSARVESDFYE